MSLVGHCPFCFVKFVSSISNYVQPTWHDMAINAGSLLHRVSIKMEWTLVGTDDTGRGRSGDRNMRIAVEPLRKQVKCQTGHTPETEWMNDTDIQQAIGCAGLRSNKSIIAILAGIGKSHHKGLFLSFLAILHNGIDKRLIFPIFTHYDLQIGP